MTQEKIMPYPRVFLLAAVFVASLCQALFSPAFSQTIRTVPDTSYGIHIWNDQLLAREMTDAQLRFAATHYDGTQKILRSYADQFRSYNPNFLILHYRLGQMLGYRDPGPSCTPGSVPTRIIEGDQWIEEYPGDAVVNDNWFYHYNGSSRVYFCSWGSWLMNSDDSGWRSYWSGEVLRQLSANDDDGVFMDSITVPNYLGVFSPAFPAIDINFETQWSAKITRWLQYVKGRFGDRYLLIPNAGHWVTTRDVTDFTPADGVMIEGFGKWDQYSSLDLVDWQLQMNRILSLEKLGKIIIAQSYLDGPADLAARNYFIANYLLVKGTHTFLNLELGLDPEWFPEYEVPIGAPLDSIPADVNAWKDQSTGLYRRYFSNGLVVLNPGTTTISYSLDGTYYLMNATGGGYLPSSGIPDGSLSYTPVTSITLAPGSGAVLLASLGPAIANVSAASYSGPILAGESIASIFGSNLSTTTGAAQTLPLPVSLGGTSVLVRDSQGNERSAGLFYVSPGQINYQLPAGTATGRATVSVIAGGSRIASGRIQVTAVSPAIFAADSSGRGLASGQVQRVRLGVSTYEQIAVWNSVSRQFVPVAVNVADPTEQAFLVLYGTGIRNRAIGGQATARANGVDVPVFYAGPQGGYAGVDQVNILLPGALAGAGRVKLVLTVDGQMANTVEVVIK